MNRKMTTQYQHIKTMLIADFGGLIHFSGSDISFCSGRPKLGTEKGRKESVLFQRYYEGQWLDRAEPAPWDVGLVVVVELVHLLVLVVHGKP
jgi:hypothetical protein